MALPETTTVAIHCDDETTLDRLTATLKRVPGMRLVDDDQGRRITLVDTRAGESAATVRRIVDGGGTCLAVTHDADADAVAELLVAGAQGCVAARADAVTLEQSIAAAARGIVTLPVALARSLAARLATAPDHPAGAPRVDRATVEQVIAERRFDVVAQPIADLRTGEIVAVESLARFTAEPALPPNLWLAAAEALGLRVALEHELLRAAVALLERIPGHIALDVNLSPAAATDPAMAEILDGVPLHRLIIEITDHRQLDDYEPLSEALSGLRTSGLRIAVDDSGHGLTSLQQVAQLAPSFMKLNRTLTRNIDRDPTKNALAYALAAFAAQIGSAIIAEGLETEAELQALRALGAPLGQGYLLAHPRPLDELQLGARLSLPAPDRAGTAPGPAFDLAGIMRDDFHEAARVALRMLGRRHPEATFAVAHLDYVRRRHTVIASRGALAEQLEPGRSTRVEETMAFQMAAGRGSRVCDDVGADPVYGGLPLARHLEAGSYIGVPLELPDGTRMGALFGVARAPRAFSTADLPLLDAIGTVLGTVLVQQSGGASNRGELLHYLRELARTDSVTGVLNRPGFAEFLDDELRRPPGRREGAFVGVEVEDLESLRKQYGRTVADLALKDLAAALRASAEVLDPVGRLADNRFGVLLLCDAHEAAVPRLLQGLGSRLTDFMARREVTLSVRAGAVPLRQLSGRGEAWARAAETATAIGA